MAGKTIKTRSLGKRVKKLRLSMKLTQKELAEKLNLAEKNISRLETGAGGCSLAVLIDIANFFGVGTDFLLGSLIHNPNIQMQTNTLEQELIDEIDDLTEMQIKYILKAIHTLRECKFK